MTAPRVLVAMPWRPTPDRLQAFQYARDWYIKTFPQWSIGCSDNGSAEFSRAGSRNACARTALAGGFDVVVINDADTVPEVGAVAAAVHGAADDGLLHFGLSTMRYLTQEETAAVYAGEEIDRNGNSHDSSVLAIQPKAYFEAGGQDERFTGYGGEDNAFCAATTALLGNPVWHDGQAISLWHDASCRDIGSERWRPNSALAVRYSAVRYNAEGMRHLINERDYQGAVHV